MGRRRVVVSALVVVAMLPVVAGSVGPLSAAYPDIDVVGVASASQGGQNGVDCGVPATAGAVVANIVAIRPQAAAGFDGTGFLAAGAAGLDPSEPATHQLEQCHFNDHSTERRRGYSKRH